MDSRLEVIGIPVSDVDVVADSDGNGWSVQGFKR
jgi:hypothetical protein